MNILPSEYIADLRNALAQVDLAAVQQAVVRLDRARRDGRMILVGGNGGSAATASHFAADLNKLSSSNEPFSAMCLMDNIPLLTAWANDEDYQASASSQLRNFVELGSVLVIISTSGESQNLWRMMRQAKQMHLNLTQIAIIGTPDSTCAKLADICILTPAPRQTQQEDVALAVCHMIAEALR